MTLETERLILRQWEERDCYDLVEALNDINTLKWLGGFFEYPYTLEMAQKFIKIFGTSQNEWAIFLKEKNKVIGGTSIAFISDDKWNIKFANEGITYINKKYVNNGYGSEAFKRKLEYVFNELDVDIYNSAFDDGNISSYNLQVKFGATINGLKLNNIPNLSDGIARNSIQTCITKGDFNKVNNKN